jgi:carbonic anhydrase
MSIADDLLKANQDYARTFRLGQLPMAPARKLAIVTCMDSRLSMAMLGLKNGDAHIIRNAGGIVTEDVLRSLILSHHLVGVEEFIIINHTDCGMLTFKDEEMRARLQAKTGATAAVPAQFHSFTDLEANVRQQIERVKSHPWLAETIVVRGFVYDVTTGKLGEVEEKPGARKVG